MLILATLALLAPMGQTQDTSWDLKKCRESLTRSKIEEGHTCSPGHLEEDLAYLLDHPDLSDATDEAARDLAVVGWAEILKEQQEQKKKQKEFEASLDPERRGAALLEQCETFLRAFEWLAGTKDPPKGNLLGTGWLSGMCAGYVSGVFETMSLDTKTYCFPKWTVRNVICVPDGVTKLQVIRVVVKFLKDHPERHHQYRHDLVVEAIKGAFPCSTD